MTQRTLSFAKVQKLRKSVTIICDSMPGALTSCAQMLGSLKVELLRRGYNVQIAGIGAEPAVRAEPLGVYCQYLKSERLTVRALAEASSTVALTIKLARAIRRRSAESPTLVVLYVPSLFLAIPAVLLSRLCRAPLYLIQRDIVPDWLIAAGRIRPGIASGLLFALKNFTLRRADAIGIECLENWPFFPERFHKKTMVLNNWRDFDADLRQVAARVPEASACTFVYGGRIGIAQGFDSFLQAFAVASDVGKLGVYCDDRGAKVLHNMASWHQCAARVDLHHMLSEEAFLVAAAPARYGVICLSASMKTHNIPGKLLSYLAAGIPVFAVGVRGSALHRVIEELNCGVFVDASDPASIASMIRLVAHDDAARHTHQLAAIAARSKFCVKTAVDQIISQSHRDS